MSWDGDADVVRWTVSGIVEAPALSAEHENQMCEEAMPVKPLITYLSQF